MTIWEKGDRITNPEPDGLDSFGIHKTIEPRINGEVGHRNAIVFNSYHGEEERDLVLAFLQGAFTYRDH